ncbi:hypothetical protein OZK63_39080 [Streptomyces sp. UMAF16]|nr:hypothetical protein [Streptomyces sp. UMAF16]
MNAQRAKFPHLVAGAGCVVAAKNIRIELKRAFPSVKFSVRSDKFAGGDAVNVDWTDGPTVAQVDEILEKYKAGSFDGMTDCYEYRNHVWGDAFGDAKFISTSRSFSDEFILSVLANFTGTIDGEPFPSLDDYRKGRHEMAGYRMVRLALVDTARI